MRRSPLFAAAAVVVSLVSLHVGTATTFGAVRSFHSVSERQGVLTFKLRGLQGARVQSAKVVGRRGKALRVSVRRVERATRRGLLRVPMPRRWRVAEARARKASARAAHHNRGSHRLRVVTDTTPPETTITSGPSGSTSSTTASFGFSSSESGSAFDCRLDGSAWAGCSPPKSYSGLTNGDHTFEVRARDAAGNIDATPASRSFSVVSSTPTPEPTPEPPPTTSTCGTKAVTRAIGSPMLSDAAAAACVRRSSWEPRPENATANQRVPTAAELETYRAENRDRIAAYTDKVTGQFKGTTDEIIQWAAWKWGVDEDLMRAVCVQESYWRQSANGDAGQSWGLTQVKANWDLNSYVGWHGTYPLSRYSTAFNADFWGAHFRYYYDGYGTWLRDFGHDYQAGDTWGSVGAWFSGSWHDSGAESYNSSVRSILSQRTWQQSSF